MKLPRAVVDTNVLVSGLMNRKGSPGLVIAAMAASLFVPLCDERIFSEYENVLRRARFGFEPDVVAELLRSLEGQVELVVATPLPFELPDPQDAPFLEVAISGEADALVTGNARDFAGAPPGLVVSPRGFLEQLRSGH